MTAMEGTSFLHADNSDRSISFGAPDWEQHAFLVKINPGKWTHPVYAPDLY
jgi:hypothetical protein